MLDTIRTLTDLPQTMDVRMAADDIVAARQRRVLQHQARRWARDCVDQARRDADAVRAEAFQQGYADGILRATADLANGLLEKQALGQALRNDLLQAARQLLGDLLSRDEWLEEMLERWLADQPGQAQAVLQVLLPMRCKPRADELRQRLQALWPGTIVLEFHQDERYLLRLADQLLEFDTETTRQRLEPGLLSRLTKLPESVRSLDQASLQRLNDLCSTFDKRVAEKATTQVRHED